MRPATVAERAGELGADACIEKGEATRQIPELLHQLCLQGSG